MKKFLSIIAIVFFMASCSTKPDDVIHETKSEAAGWTVDKSVSQNPIQKYEDYYKISPTWGQSINYAKKAPDFPIALALGIICLAGAGILFYLKSTDSSLISEKADKIVIYVVFVLLVAGVYSIYSKPGDIRWNNDKWVKKEVYDKAIKEAGSTQPIWDSLENNCLIVSGPCK